MTRNIFTSGMRGGVAATWVLWLSGCAALSLPFPVEKQANAPPEAARTSPELHFLLARDLELEGRFTEAFEHYALAAAQDPDSAYLHLKVAELAARQGRFEEALSHAQKAVELEPEDVRARVFLGTLYRLRKEPEAAEAVLRGAAGEPLGPDAALLLYSIYLDAERFDEALAVGQWLIKEDAAALRGYFAVAGVYERQERFAEVERVLREALAQDPGSLAVFGALARLRREQGNREGEIAVYQEILEIHPNHHATLVALADAQLGLERIDAALATLHTIEKHYPADVRSSIRLGLLYFEAERYDEAIRRFESAYRSHPERYELAYFLGLVRQRSGDEKGALATYADIPEKHERYAAGRTQAAAVFERRGDYGRAIAEVERARERQPHRSLDLYLASLRAKSGDFDEAVEFLKQLLEKNPDDAELLYNLGVLYGERRHYEEAIRYMQSALAKDPDHASAMNYIGYTWADQGRNLEEAEALIKRALELRPDDGYITDSLGWVYYMRARPLFEAGRRDDGVQWLQRALEKLEQAAALTGGDPVVTEHIGDVYLLLDQKQQALEKYEEALMLEPRENEQPNLWKKLEQLRRELGKQGSP